MIPASSKQASYNHLCNVKENKLSGQTLGQICNRDLTDISAMNNPSEMPKEFFDSAMRCISEGLERITNHRAPIEGMCCEAKHGQITREKY